MLPRRHPDRIRYRLIDDHRLVDQRWAAQLPATLKPAAWACPNWYRSTWIWAKRRAGRNTGDKIMTLVSAPLWRAATASTTADVLLH